MIRTRPIRPTWRAMGSATIVLLAACGSDDSASEDTSRSPATQLSTTEVSAPSPTSVAPELATTVAPTTTPQPTSPPSTSAAPAPTTPEVSVEDWATDVVAVYGQLTAAQVENAVEFVGWLPDDGTEPMYEDEVDAFLVLAAADAGDVAAAIDGMPGPRSEEADLALVYGALVEALRAEADGAGELAERIEANLDTYRQEAVESQVVPPPEGGPVEGSYNEVRADFAKLQNEVTSACFGLQAALTERNLALINCTGS